MVEISPGVGRARNSNVMELDNVCLTESMGGDD